MIPAILSCVFVLYLYRTLSETEAVTADESSSTDQASIANQIEALQHRVDRLVSDVHKGAIE